MLEHECEELHEENLLRFFDKENVISYLFDEIGNKAYLNIGLEQIKVKYCSFCGKKLDTRVESIAEKIQN